MGSASSSSSPSPPSQQQLALEEAKRQEKLNEERRAARSITHEELQKIRSLEATYLNCANSNVWRYGFVSLFSLAGFGIALGATFDAHVEEHINLTNAANVRDRQQRIPPPTPNRKLALRLACAVPAGFLGLYAHAIVYTYLQSRLISQIDRSVSMLNQKEWNNSNRDVSELRDCASILCAMREHERKKREALWGF